MLSTLFRPQSPTPTPTPMNFTFDEKLFELTFEKKPPKSSTDYWSATIYYGFYLISIFSLIVLK